MIFSSICDNQSRGAKYTPQLCIVIRDTRSGLSLRNGQPIEMQFLSRKITHDRSKVAKAK